MNLEILKINEYNKTFTKIDSEWVVDYEDISTVEYEEKYNSNPYMIDDGNFRYERMSDIDNVLKKGYEEEA